MKHSIHNLKKAREMRLSGNSLSEISREFDIPISTLSNWFKDIRLSDKQILDLNNRVKNRVDRGRLNSSISVRSKKIYKEKIIYDESEREFLALLRDPFFILGLGLYITNGSNKNSHFLFTNSDQSIIKIMDRWIKKYIPIEHHLIKHRSYNGYLRIVITRIDVLRKMIAWQKLLIKYYSGV